MVPAGLMPHCRRCCKCAAETWHTLEELSHFPCVANPVSIITTLGKSFELRDRINNGAPCAFPFISFQSQRLLECTVISLRSLSCRFCRGSIKFCLTFMSKESFTSAICLMASLMSTRAQPAGKRDNDHGFSFCLTEIGCCYCTHILNVRQVNFHYRRYSSALFSVGKEA